ncbi:MULTISPECIES: hypothetical protein [Pseudomonas]|uniref:hypothetical protein n=1 Tax=Pseudomonas TaxID=286 RepID=UPI0011B22E64|nr:MULTISPECIES: hypothetical protein [Pseudomonas]ULT72329.1 hypothetical protein L1O02_08175 [Pseudomonas sp. BC42]
MKNHYSVGFYGLLAAFTILVCALFYSTFTDGRPESTDKAFSLISAVSALIQTIAAVLVAGLAFKGWNSWKLQIVHGKALGVVWDANVALREVEAAMNVLEARWIRSYAEGSDQSTELDEAGIVGKALRSFRDQCVLLDKVVVKNEWEWQNYSNDLYACIRGLVDEQKKEKYVAVDSRRPASTRGVGSILNRKTDESVAEKRDAFKAVTDTIATKLSALEAEYL